MVERSFLLSDLLEGAVVHGIGSANPREIRVSSICVDSRQVRQSSLFFALRGSSADGTEYISEAVDRGASCVIADRSESVAENALSQAPLFVTADARAVLAVAASNYYGRADEKLLTVGVTGTNGKTTVTWLIANALSRLSYPAAHIGTLGSRFIGPKEFFWSAKTTTPDALELHSFLSEALEQGAKAGVIEVSSHGIVQRRTHGIAWDCGIFTNLSRDHLDYHGTLEEYAKVKAQFLVEDLPQSKKTSKLAIVNREDPLGKEILTELRQEGKEIVTLSYSSAGNEAAEAFIVKSEGDLYHTEIQAIILGKSLDIHSSLIGDYNAENLLAAATCLYSLGFSVDEVQSALREVPCVPGRLELAVPCEIPVFVDYAHTPDGLVNAQQSLRKLVSGRLITVFGCGGDRDRGKRPLMGSAVAELSDFAIVTSDNPRTEDPGKIIEDIIPGLVSVLGPGEGTHEVIVDRREAIEHAIKEAQPGDAVLVAGKGHEDYQEIDGVRHSFSDSEVCRCVLKEMGKAD